MKLELLKIYPLIVFLFISNCRRSGPVDVDHQNDYGTNRGYYLYVGNWGGNEVFIVDTDSNVVVDTLHGFGTSVSDLDVTKSGTKLYVCASGPDRVFSVDLKKKTLSPILEKYSDIYIAPGGTVFVISSITPVRSPRLVGAIDTLSNAVSFFDTLDMRDTGHNYQSMVFDRNRPLLYAVNSTNQLFAYDYEKREVVHIYKNLYGPTLRMVISPDGKTLYVAGGPVFDLERDSVIAAVGGNHLGSLALSPGGELLYITDPGKYMLPEPVPSGKVFIFHTATTSYLGYIDVNKASGEAYTMTDRIVLTPDGKIAYVSRWLEKIFVIDLQVKEVVKVIALPGFTIPMAIGLK